MHHPDQYLKRICTLIVHQSLISLAQASDYIGTASDYIVTSLDCIRMQFNAVRRILLQFDNYSEFVRLFKDDRKGHKLHFQSTR